MIYFTADCYKMYLDNCFHVWFLSYLSTDIICLSCDCCQWSWWCCCVCVKGVVHGVTGIVVQPVEGAKQEGVSGFFKGRALTLRLMALLHRSWILKIKIR